MDLLRLTFMESYAERMKDVHYSKVKVISNALSTAFGTIVQDVCLKVILLD